MVTSNGQFCNSRFLLSETEFKRNFLPTATSKICTQEIQRDVFYSLLGRIVHKITEIVNTDAKNYREVKSEFTSGFQEMKRRLEEYLETDEEIKKLLQ